MRLRERITACFLSVIFIAGAVSCSKIDDSAKTACGQYISAIASGDVDTLVSISDLTSEDVSKYLNTGYKDKVVSTILNSSSYVIDDKQSDAREKNNDGVVVCVLSVPDYVSVDAAKPSNMEEFSSLLSQASINETEITVSMVFENGAWKVVNGSDSLNQLVGPMLVPEYTFAQDSSYFFEDTSWDNVSGTSRGSISDDITDALEIILNIQLTDEAQQSFNELNLTYEFSNEASELAVPVSLEGDVELHGDGLAVINLMASDLEQNSLYFPQDVYTLNIYKSGDVIWSDNIEVYLSESAFPSRSLIEHIFWQYTDSSGSYFNTNQIEAKLILNDSYLESGRETNITYNIIYNGEYLLEGAELDFDTDGYVCVYHSDDYLQTGNYMIEVFNNGLVAGTASVSVLFNLDPERYHEVEIPDEVTDSEDGELVIFSGSTGAADMISDYTNVDFTRRVLNLNTFRHDLDAALASGENAPDMFVCDIGYASYYAASDNTIPLNNIGISYSDFRYMYEYTFNMGMDQDGVIKGVTWEIQPGAVYYNRTVAQNIFGVSEPEEIQPYFSSWDVFLDTSRYVHDSSNGNVRIICNPADIETPYIYSRQDAWFVDGEVEIPDYLMGLFDLGKILTDEELTFGSARWSSEWSGRMNNRTVLSYFGTLEFGDLFLSGNSSKWGVVRAPEDYYDGGYYIFVTKYCDMDYSAYRVIRDIAISTINLEDMAQDGCAVNNLNIMLSCAADDSYARTWLDGQNPYRVFTGAAWSLNGRAISVYDEDINNVFANVVRGYCSGSFNTIQAAENAFYSNLEE